MKGAAMKTDLSFVDKAVQDIALPNESPSLLTQINLPEGVLRSQAVETLLNENEDLMARLNVSLRRITLTEQKWEDLKRENETLKHKLSSLRDQILVLSEKDRLTTERYAASDETITKLKNQVTLLEKKYTDLYISTKEHSRHQQNIIAQFSRRISRLDKYRRNIRRMASHLRLRLTQTVKELDRAIQDRVTAQNHLEALSQRLQDLYKESEVTQKRLTEQYETQISALNSQMLNANEKISALTAQAQQLEGLYNHKVQLENALVLEQRKREQILQEHSTETQNLKSRLLEAQAAVSSQSERSSALEAQLNDAQLKLADVTTERDRQSEQIETLQCLWRENHDKAEKADEKNIALQKLNQELSVKVHDLRRMTQELKISLETERLRSAESMKLVLSEVNLLKKQALKDSTASQLSHRDDLLRRLDHLLTEIQTGHTPDK